MQICSCTNVCGSRQIYQSVHELSPETGLDAVSQNGTSITFAYPEGLRSLPQFAQRKLTRKWFARCRIFSSTAILAARYAQVLTVSRPLMPLGFGFLPKGLVGAAPTQRILTRRVLEACTTCKISERGDCQHTCFCSVPERVKISVWRIRRSRLFDARYLLDIFHDSGLEW